jgi:hypothetical protein
MTMMMTPMTTPGTPTKRKRDTRAACFSIQRDLAFTRLSYWGIMPLAVFLTFQLLIFPATSAAVHAPDSAPAFQRKPSPDDCIFYATVFTNEGRLLVGAEIHAHPTGKKRPDYVAWSDRRGEFAVRVPHGGDYDIQVKADKFITQVRTAHAETGQQNMVFHMELQPEKKPK